MICNQSNPLAFKPIAARPPSRNAHMQRKRSIRTAPPLLRALLAGALAAACALTSVQAGYAYDDGLDFIRDPAALRAYRATIGASTAFVVDGDPALERRAGFVQVITSLVSQGCAVDSPPAMSSPPRRIIRASVLSGPLEEAMARVIRPETLPESEEKLALSAIQDAAKQMKERGFGIIRTIYESNPEDQPVIYVFWDASKSGDNEWRYDSGLVEAIIGVSLKSKLSIGYIFDNEIDVLSIEENYRNICQSIFFSKMACDGFYDAITDSEFEVLTPSLIDQCSDGYNFIADLELSYSISIGGEK